MHIRRAFTIIELLVVVAVIAVLMAILLPSLARARKQARTVVCETHQRALVHALRLYVSEWNTGPVSGGHGAVYGAWDYQILGGGVTQQAYYASNARRDVTDNIRWCPETSRPRRPGANVGTATRCWDCRAGGYGGSTGSYGLNNWLYRPEGYSAKGGSVKSADFYTIWRPVSNEATIPVFADAVWHDFLPRTTDVPGVNLQDPEGNTSADRTLADVCLDRHARAVNVAFLDGHVETVKLGKLWTLKWSATWSRGTAMTVK